MARLRLKYILAISTISAILVLAAINNEKFRFPDDNRTPYKSKRYLVNTPGCRIPDFNPFDPSIVHLYKPVGPLICPGPPSLVIFNRTHMTMDMNTAMKRFHDNIECFYRSIKRKDEKNDNTYEFGDIRIFDGTVKVKDDFIKVECMSTSSSKTRLYTELLPFIQEKAEVEERCDEIFEKWRQETESVIYERLSVTFVGIDSTSRHNMIRQMNKTYNFLRSNNNIIDLKGFIKLADNTFVNVVPLLTGLFVEECWNETMHNVPLDYLNIIWKDFSDKGYRTFYAEDCPDIAAFNYVKSGFAKQPTDYYMRPFYLAVSDSDVNKAEANCHNSRPEATVNLQYLLDFLTTFKTKPTFAYLFNSCLSHWSLNSIGQGDDLYLDFLQQYNKNLLHNNSILIFFSDHGVRYGDIRNTYVGKLEERMPFVFIQFPGWFREKYPKLWKNLRVNQNRLTTFLDLYETLKQILHFTGEATEPDTNNRGLSLFSEIPPERTCKNAAILPHWCTCHEKKSVALNDSHVVASAKLIAEELNRELMSEGKKCAYLTVHEIKDARTSGLSEEILRFQHSRNDVINRKVIYGDKSSGIWEYLVTMSVKPSGAILEGTVKYLEGLDTYKLTGDVSRINKYGNQSHCVTSEHLKKFCFCI